MKKMKFLALMMALIMAVSVLTACGGSAAPATPATEAAPQVTEAAPVEEAPAEVEAWAPTKDITFVVPYEAGGNSDIPARIFAKYMSKYASVSVNVTNIEGAGGRTGAQQAMEMDADGSVVLMQPVAYPMQYSMGVANFTYEDFEPVGQWLNSCLALVVNADSGIENLEQFVAKAQAAPGTVKLGSVSGTLPFFAAMYLQKESGAEYNLVDLSQNKAPELLSNRIDAYIDGFGAVKQYVDSGEFKCIALFTDTEIASYEHLDTLAELNYEGFGYLKQCFGMWAPKGTPAEAVAYINGIMKQASEDPECVAELIAAGFGPAYMTVDEYTAFMAETYATFVEAAEGLAG